MNEPTSERLGRVVLAFLWFDLGMLILLLPWSHAWGNNPLLARFPGLIPYLLSGYVRGIVSGIGVLDMVFAAEALIRRRPTSVETQR